MDIQQVLFESRDLAYREFQAKLIPNIAKESILGVRTPILREMAKKLKKEAQERDFLERLPHAYFDENRLHAFTISLEKDFERCVASVEVFLPYVDNWATCDQLSPKVFKKHRRELLSYIKKQGYHFSNPSDEARIRNGNLEDICDVSGEYIYIEK